MLVSLFDRRGMFLMRYYTTPHYCDLFSFHLPPPLCRWYSALLSFYSNISHLQNSPQHISSWM